MKSYLMAAVALVIPFAPALAGEADVVDLRKEVVALRTEVAKLNARLAGGAELGRKLVAVARKLAAGEEIKEGSAEMGVLRTALRTKGTGLYGSGVAQRTMGVMRKLPAGLRAKLLKEVLVDITVSDRVRGGILAELVLVGDESAGKAIAAACEMEVLLPAVSAGYAYRSSYFLSKLIVAAADFKDKRAVGLTITMLATRIKAGKQSPHYKKYGARLYSSDAKLAARLAAWSGHAGWKELLAKHKYKPKHGGGGQYLSYAFKGEKASEAALAQLAEIGEWWKKSKGEFVFPNEKAAPVKPVTAPVVKDTVKPVKPVEQF